MCLWDLIVLILRLLFDSFFLRDSAERDCHFLGFFIPSRQNTISNTFLLFFCCLSIEQISFFYFKLALALLYLSRPWSHTPIVSLCFRLSKNYASIRNIASTIWKQCYQSSQLSSALTRREDTIKSKCIYSVFAVFGQPLLYIISRH